MSYHQWAERKTAPGVRSFEVVEFVEHDRLATTIREALRAMQAA